MIYTYVTHQTDNHPRTFTADNDDAAINHLKTLYGPHLIGVIIVVNNKIDANGDVQTVWIE